MKYQTFSPQEKSTYPIAILTPKLEQDGMEREYMDTTCLDPEDVIAYGLHQTGKKTKVTVQREYLDELMPVLNDLETEYVVVTDSDYFKTLTGVNKADAYLGYVLPNVYPENLKGTFNVLFCPSFRQVFYDPGRTRARIAQALDALWDHMHNTYDDPGHNLLTFSDYPQTGTEIKAWLDKLLEMDCDLTCDTEGFSLKHFAAGMGTISFAWNKSEGISFPIDLGPESKYVRSIVKDFFVKFKRKMTYHNISYDGTVLIFQMFMENIIDTEGLLEGLDVILRNWDDTKLISYLATNTCAGNKLSLKDQAQEYAGNYAVEEIKDITKIPLPELLEYNLVDACSTWFVKEKHWDTMVADNQLEIYEELFKPAIVDIIQMQLTGMPLNMDSVAKAKTTLKVDLDDAISRIQGHKLIREFTYMLEEEHVEKRNNELKTKQIKMGDEPQKFNPNSPPQMQALLYEMLELPIIERTKTKQPSSGADVLAKLMAGTDEQPIIDLLRAILDFKAVDKIYTTFIPAMEGAILAPDGCYYLFGNFNLGGTVSGRLSSSGPNLQTIPATGSIYAKLIKACFEAPKGWLMIGLDFASLEDRISAVTTKDKNKLKVYTDGYDGHCLRAFSYFGERMPDIEDTVKSINLIKNLYPDERQDGKTPTFLLTYGGTYIGMIAKCGFSKAVALQIEQRYHDLYAESDQWVAERLKEASQCGYITAAFGLRVRTPLLSQVILGNRATPFEAEAEGRTAGNALGQSWCLLNSRASIEFMRKVRAGKYRTKIRPIAHIHDAQYYLIPDDIEVLMYVNKHLVKAVEWQEHPAIAHDQVKLGGELAIYYPNWATEIELPNAANENTIRTKVADKLEKLKEAA